MNRVFEVDGRERFARMRGSPELPCAVFVHPFMLNSLFWWDQLEGLSNVRHCVALDLPGFGRSEPFDLRAIDLEAYARDLLRTFDALGIAGPVDLVGLSGSAMVSVIAAVAAPERVASLTLMSAPFIDSMGPAYDRYRAEMARLAVVEDKGVVFRRMLDYVVGRSLGLPERARYRSMLEETRYEMLVAFLTNTKFALPGDIAGRLIQPVLFPVGDQDSLISPDQTQAQAGTLRDARVVVLPDCGRFPPIEAPTALNAALEEFWTGPARRSPAQLAEGKA